MHLVLGLVDTYVGMASAASTLCCSRCTSCLPFAAIAQLSGCCNRLHASARSPCSCLKVGMPRTSRSNSNDSRMFASMSAQHSTVHLTAAVLVAASGSCGCGPALRARQARDASRVCGVYKTLAVQAPGAVTHNIQLPEPPRRHHCRRSRSSSSRLDMQLGDR
jgi:hypothetical protein